MMTPQRQTRQLTFDGGFSPALPPVRTTDGHIIDWDRSRIADQIKTETKLAEAFYGYEGADDCDLHRRSPARSSSASLPLA